MAYDNNHEAEEASSLLQLARQTHEAHVAAARKKADDIVSAAQAHASETVSAAQHQADSILTSARDEFRELEGKIAGHRDFELRYREALKGYLKDLLDEISQDDDFIAPEGFVTEEQPSAFAPVDEQFHAPVEHEPVAVEEPAPLEETGDAPEVPAFGNEQVNEIPEEETQPYTPSFADELQQEEAPVEEHAPVEEYDHLSEYSAEADQQENVPAFEEPVLEAQEAPAFVEQEAAFGDEQPYDVPEFASGDEAPVPAFSEEPVQEEEQPTEDDDPSDDLPEVPENLDSLGTSSAEIQAYDEEVQEENGDQEEQERSFDQLIAGEPKPATGAVAAHTPLFEDDEEKKTKSFFGFKKS